VLRAAGQGITLIFSMAAPRNPQERRRWPRIPVRARVPASADGFAEEVTVRDVSEGGFLVETLSPFAVGAEHAFRVKRSSGALVTMLIARCVHCRRNADPLAPEIYLAGFAFVDPTGEAARARIHALIDHVTSVVTIE
jgi:hypothetical protein